MFLILFLFQNLWAVDLTNIDRLNYFNSQFPNPDCKVTDTDKLIIIHSQIKCLVMNKEKVEIRFSCKPEEVKLNLKNKLDQHCKDSVDDFSANTPIKKQQVTIIPEKPKKKN